MKPDIEKQIVLVIGQFESQKKFVPYLHHLDAHEMYGSFFQELSDDEREDVKEVINAYIRAQIAELSTKGGEMFKRFYALNKEIFRTFRALNADEENVEKDEFHEIGHQIEQGLYRFEQILTKNMMKKPIGLGKVTEAFYDIAYRFFPYYHRIK